MKQCTALRIENVETCYEIQEEKKLRKLTLEDRIVQFFSSYPTITKHWLYPKM